MEEPTLGSLDWTCHEAGNLSPRQVLRMANEGKFPQPVRVTEGNERQKGHHSRLPDTAMGSHLRRANIEVLDQMRQPLATPG